MSQSYLQNLDEYDEDEEVGEREKAPKNKAKGAAAAPPSSSSPLSARADVHAFLCTLFAVI
jgi:hypothetical protein